MARSPVADPRLPCIVGVAQRTIRPEERPAPEPLALWEDVCRQAAADSHAPRDLLAVADSLQIVFCHSWRYDDPPGRLADRLEISPRHQHYSGIGGTTPQVLVQEAAQSILRGDIDVAVICGAETLATLKVLTDAGESPPWSHAHPTETPFPQLNLHPGEVAAGMAMNGPAAFALWDTARRAHLRIGPDEYRLQIGELMAPMTDVAAGNPHAWFRRSHDADFLITPQPDNRMVAYPYTKHTLAIMDVDMAAAVIVASQAAADRLGIPTDRRVYLHGWCYAKAPEHAAMHAAMWEVPAMKAAADEALNRAQIHIGDVAHLDLYSCFASALNLARDALGVHERPGDRLTVTGGLPYAGGPASNYMTHSIAAMADVLREDPESFGMVSGVGMLMEKHVFGVYGANPPRALPQPPDQDAVQARLDAVSPKAIAGDYAGPATVAAYSVAYDRNGPAYGVAICDLPDGARAYASFEDAEFMAHAEAGEIVGQEVGLVAAGDASELKA